MELQQGLSVHSMRESKADLQRYVLMSSQDLIILKAQSFRACNCTEDLMPHPLMFTHHSARPPPLATEQQVSRHIPLYSPPPPSAPPPPSPERSQDFTLTG